MKITEQYLRSIIKEAIEEVKDELEEAESKEAIGYDAEVGGYHVHFNEKTGAISTITDKSNKKVSMKDIPAHVMAKINARVKEVTKKFDGKAKGKNMPKE
jgi:hypothetical protein